MIAKILREPLLHVVVLGTALFALHRWIAPAPAEEIVVTADLVAGIRQDFSRRMGRPPWAQEEQTAIDQYVDDEIAVREALAMGLDRGDVIVRRRLIQKMEFMFENAEPLLEPSDAELGAYLAKHAAHFATPERTSLVHVFAATQVHGDAAQSVADGFRRALDGGADPARLGDPFLRGREMRLNTDAELTNAFGPGFASQVKKLSPGAWSPPIRSSFGWHIVRVDERQPGAAPALDQVRERVARDWRFDRRRQLNAEARLRLRQRYHVRRETPAS